MYYDFIEIGTADFDAIVHSSHIDSNGICVEPMIELLNKLPNKPNVKKLNYAMSDYVGETQIYYVEKSLTTSHTDPHGWNCIESPHPKYKDNPESVSQRTVNVINFQKLVELNDITGIGFLKVDTEGHDLVILNDYIETCIKNKSLFAKKIKFESNKVAVQRNMDNMNRDQLNSVINKLTANGYHIESKGHDTIAVKKG